MRHWRMLLVLAVLLAQPIVQAEDWNAGREIHCRDHLPGCRLLQMVMMGSFDICEPWDSVTERVLAAAWPRLLEVTEEDIIHFCDEFGEDTEHTRTHLYGAMAQCLRACIDQDAQMSPQRKVLILFLDRSDTPEALAARDEIRENMTESVLQSIADDIAAPIAFVQWVLYAEE